MVRVHSVYYICAWLTVQRYLVEANLHQLVLILAGRYEPVAYLHTLRQLATLIEIGVCPKTRTISDDEMPPLLPLLAQLPPHMQAALEQAIEAEQRGHSTHRASWWHRYQVLPAWLQSFQSIHRAAWGPPSGRTRQQDG